MAQLERGEFPAAFLLEPEHGYALLGLHEDGGLLVGIPRARIVVLKTDLFHLFSLRHHQSMQGASTRSCSLLLLDYDEPSDCR